MPAGCMVASFNAAQVLVGNNFWVMEGVTFVALEVACLHHGILMLQMVSGTVLVAPLVARRT